MKTSVIVGCAIVLASSLAAYAWLKPDRDPPNAAAERAQPAAREQHEHAPSPAAALRPPIVSPRAKPGPTVEMRERPHPITATRAAITEQSSAFLEIEQALSGRDIARAKQLLKAHEQRLADFDGGAEARQGYEAIARCIESPGAQSRANGERFVAQHRASPLRRKVRHACLGQRQPVMLPPA